MYFQGSERGINKNTILTPDLVKKIPRRKDTSLDRVFHCQDTVTIKLSTYHSLKNLQKDQNPFMFTFFFSFQRQALC